LALGTRASALGGDLRPKSSGRKKSMKSEAVPNELGSHKLSVRERVGSSIEISLNTLLWRSC